MEEYWHEVNYVLAELRFHFAMQLMVHVESSDTAMSGRILRYMTLSTAIMQLITRNLTLVIKYHWWQGIQMIW